MKYSFKIQFLLCVLFGITLTVAGQNKAYVTAMKKNIVFIDSARGINQLQNLANAFEKIAQEEKSEWLPCYYEAYCYATMAQGSKGNTIDSYCDKADMVINKADSLQPNNSEIYTVKAQIASARISVNIAKRGAKYGKQSADFIDKAKKLDPSNPRAWLVEGQNKFYTPPVLGGGKQKAKPVFEKALLLYDTFKPLSSIRPDWGKRTAVYFLKKCTELDKQESTGNQSKKG